MNFIAKEISTEIDEDNNITVAFSSSNDEYFMIQFSGEFDEQDVKLGTDTYHIEKNNQSMGTFGGIENIQLYSDRITFNLNQKGQLKLEEKNIQITINCSDQQFENLSLQLSNIFNSKEEHLLSIHELKN